MQYLHPAIFRRDVARTSALHRRAVRMSEVRSIICSMTLTWLVASGLILSGIIRITRQMRGRSDTVLVRDLRDASITIGLLTAGFLLVICIYIRDSLATVLLAAGYVATLILVVTVFRRVNSLLEEPLGVARDAIREHWHHRHRNRVERAHRVWRAIVPLNDGRPKMTMSVADWFSNLLSVRSFTLVYLGGIAIAPPIIALYLPHALRQDDSELWRPVSYLIGVNALLALSCLTLAGAVVVGLVLLVTTATTGRPIIELRAGFRAFAGWVGRGSATGFFTAAVGPTIRTAFPHMSTGDPIRALDPNVLLEMPAAGAVAGASIGVIGAMIRLGTGSENLLCARFLLPAIFVGVVTVLASTTSASPARMFGVLSSTSPLVESTVCPATPPEALPEDAIDAIVLLTACGGFEIISDAAFVLATAVITLGGAVSALVCDTRRRLRSSNEDRHLFDPAARTMIPAPS